MSRTEMDQPPQRQVVALAVAGVMLGAVLQAVDGSIVNVAVPQIQLQLAAPLSWVSWTVTGYVLASLIAMPLSAALAQRLGTRRFFAGSVALFTLASAACGLSRTTAALIFFRVVQGFGAGGLLPLTQGVLMTLFPGGRRSTAVSLIGVAGVLGPLLGPPLGGVLTDLFGWRSIFWINVPLGALSIALVLRYLEVPVTEPRRRAGLDLPGVLLLAAAVVSLQFACAHHPALFPVALVAGALFLQRERRAQAPAVDLSVLRHRALKGTLLAAPLYGIGLYASVFLLPLLLEHKLSMSPSRAGLVVAVGGLCSGVFMLSARPILQRFRARTLNLVGAAAFAASMLWMARVSSSGAAGVVFAQGLRGAGTGLVYVGMQAFAFEDVPPEDVATSASLFYLLRQLGGSVGVALSALALDRDGATGMTLAFIALALTAPLSLLPMHLGHRGPGNIAREVESTESGAGPAPGAL